MKHLPLNMSKQLPFLPKDKKISSKIRMVVFDFDGVFTDNMVFVNEKGEESVRCFRSDGLGLEKLKKAGIKIWVISTEKNPVVKLRLKKLQLQFVNDLKNKEKSFRQIIAKEGLNLSQVAYVGNDINDIGCLKMSGVSIVTNDAYEEAKRFADFITRKAGGLGAVREVCDWIIGKT